MRDPLAAVGLLLLLGATGCKREQTFDEAMHVLCELPSTFDAGPDASQRAALVAQEAKRRVTNREVVAWMESTASVTPTERDAQLREMLQRARITDCWMLPAGK